MQRRTSDVDFPSRRLSAATMGHRCEGWVTVRVCTAVPSTLCNAAVTSYCRVGLRSGHVLLCSIAKLLGFYCSIVFSLR
jgi:hypothetical protein